MCGGSHRRARTGDEERRFRLKGDVARAQARQEETAAVGDLVKKQDTEAGFQQLEQRRQDAKGESEARRRTAQITSELQGQSETRLLERFLEGELDIPQDRARRIRRRTGPSNFGV